MGAWRATGQSAITTPGETQGCFLSCRTLLRQHRSLKVSIGLYEVSCPSKGASPGIKLRAESALSAAPIRKRCKRITYCMLDWVGGTVSISPTTSFLWLWVGWESTMTGVAGHAPSDFGPNSWSPLRTSIGCNFVAPDFTQVYSHY